MINGNEPDFLAPLFQRAVGAFAGTLVALAFIWPKTLKEGVQISAISFITGVVLAFPVREYILEWPALVDNRMAASAICAVVALPIIAAAHRIIQAYRKS